VVHTDVRILSETEGCPSHGRGAQRVKSCGRARKREGTGKPLGTCEGGGEAASSIGVLLSKDSTEYGSVRVNGREHRAEEKVCQSSILGRKHEQKISS
jgi:hypothetical protein